MFTYDKDLKTRYHLSLLDASNISKKNRLGNVTV